MSTCADSKDVIELLQSKCLVIVSLLLDAFKFILQTTYLRFRHEQENEHPENQTPRSIPSKRPLWFERRQQRRPREAEDKVEAPRRGCGKGHAHVANMHRECLGRIRERDRPFAWRVENLPSTSVSFAYLWEHNWPDLEQIHARGDHPNLGFIVLKPKAEACPEQKNGQEWECKQEQVPPSPPINGEHCR